MIDQKSVSLSLSAIFYQAMIIVKMKTKKRDNEQHEIKNEILQIDDNLIILSIKPVIY